MKRFRSVKWFGWLDEHLDIASLTKILSNPESLSARPGSQCILDCHGRLIHRFDLEEFPGERFLGQYFRNPSIFRLWRRPVALRLLDLSRQLRSAGLNPPQIVAAVRPRRSLWNRKSFALIREFPAVSELQATRGHDLPIHPIFSEPIENLAQPIADTLAAWHNHAFAHGDLKSRHVLVQVRYDGSRRILLIDIERTMNLKRSPLRQIYQARDLVQFLGSLGEHASEPFRENFLRHYFNARQMPPQRERFFRRVLDWYRCGQLKQGKTLLKQFLRL